MVRNDIPVLPNNYAPQETEWPGADGRPGKASRLSTFPGNLKYLSRISETMRIILHTREERKKCTLAGIRSNTAFTFIEHTRHEVDPGALFLHPDGSPLTRADRGRDLVLLDATWRDFTKLLRRDPVLAGLERRSIRGFVTAYPRKGRRFPHPEDHLASIEVIIAAGLILGIPEYADLLDSYHFRDAFMEMNGLS
jgi:ribosome biogenesis protein Tsr3